MSDLLRLYGPEELRKDGYPRAWPEINQQVVDLAGARCIRCGHPYRKGEHGKGEWSPCDERCTHRGDVRVLVEVEGEGPESAEWFETQVLVPVGPLVLESSQAYEAAWRILTVHHLNGAKADCRWWNLCALCQRCHLTIQNRVKVDQTYPFEHSEWFKPYAAGLYAVAYQGREISRETAIIEMDELLALERVV